MIRHGLVSRLPAEAVMRCSDKASQQMCAGRSPQSPTGPVGAVIRRKVRYWNPAQIYGTVEMMMRI
jgi:hypothetical protein